MLLHRKWLVLITFLLVSAGTAVVTHFLPDVYTSVTVILVDPQQVPERFVNSTVSGDIRNRLGALSQQILSATRLQTIIDRFNLCSKEKSRLVHEEVINLMRKDITVDVVSDFGGRQDLQAFKITYSGEEPRLVAQVTNELASLFIEENLKARERMATGTADFMGNQLEETRKKLEAQEALLRDFKLKHVGEMPEQQNTNLQMLSQLQTRLQAANDALNRAEQQKSYYQAMLASQNPPAEAQTTRHTAERTAPPPAPSGPSREDLQLAALLSRYGEKHPEVQLLKREMEEQRLLREAAEREQKVEPAAVASPEDSDPRPAPANSGNSTIQAQLNTIEGEISQNKDTQKRLTELITAYQSRIETTPVREQEIADLVRDYAISKDYYSKLLEKKLSAETATQLEIRQKGERFTILDPAQVPEKPSRPNRILLNVAGSLGGLALGLVLALATEFLGITITSPEQIVTATGGLVLGVIPILRTRADQRRRRWTVASAATGAVMLVLVGAFLLYQYHDRIF